MKIILGFGGGLIFSFGLTLSGMTQPAKIVGFLDFFGAWDPSLAFVMAGAIGVYAFAVRLLPKTRKPLYAPEFNLPKPRPADAPLFVGSALFGLGWGSAGICPGPGIVNLGTFEPKAVVFGVALAAGMILFGWLDNRLNPSPESKRDSRKAS